MTNFGCVQDRGVRPLVTVPLCANVLGVGEAKYPATPVPAILKNTRRSMIGSMFS